MRPARPHALPEGNPRTPGAGGRPPTLRHVLPAEPWSSRTPPASSFSSRMRYARTLPCRMAPFRGHTTARMRSVRGNTSPRIVPAVGYPGAPRLAPSAGHRVRAADTPPPGASPSGTSRRPAVRSRAFTPPGNRRSLRRTYHRGITRRGGAIAMRGIHHRTARAGSRGDRCVPSSQAGERCTGRPVPAYTAGSGPTHGGGLGASAIGGGHPSPHHDRRPSPGRPPPRSEGPPAGRRPVTTRPRPHPPLCPHGGVGQQCCPRTPGRTPGFEGRRRHRAGTAFDCQPDRFARSSAPLWERGANAEPTGMAPTAKRACGTLGGIPRRSASDGEQSAGERRKPDGPEAVRPDGASRAATALSSATGWPGPAWPWPTAS